METFLYKIRGVRVVGLEIYVMLHAITIAVLTTAVLKSPFLTDFGKLVPPGTSHRAGDGIMKRSISNAR